MHKTWANNGNLLPCMWHEVRVMKRFLESSNRQAVTMEPSTMALRAEYPVWLSSHSSLITLVCFILYLLFRVLHRCRNGGTKKLLQSRSSSNSNDGPTKSVPQSLLSSLGRKKEKVSRFWCYVPMVLLQFDYSHVSFVNFRMTINLK